MLLVLLSALQVGSADTVFVRTISRVPLLQEPGDSSRYGAPQVRIPTRQGTAVAWLLRAADTLFVLASVPDSSPYWGDDFVMSIDTRGDATAEPQHDDFQLYFRRVLDSSVVFRGRNGRWQPPRDDPDWRLGKERAGGGWEVSARDSVRGWRILIRLDPAWLAGENDRRPRIAFRIYDDSPSGWYAWPAPPGTMQTSAVEQAPALWVPVR